MFVPPPIGSKERKEHDYDLLRMLYVGCEANSISEDEGIQKSFFHLVSWAGKTNFLEEFQVFEKYIEKYREKKSSTK